MAAGTTFPADFLWGVSTSAYQIEGSPLADGAGPSNWHRFTHPGGAGAHLAPGGDLACDHYRRWPEDVALMRRLGFTSYRFSLGWSRILPEGRGRVNPAGLDFYRRLADALLEAGIRPQITLHHWDLPAALEDQGGWLHPDSPGWFADYAAVACRALADRVPTWATFNEPWVIVHEGHLQGTHPPGHQDPAEAALAARGILRAHGLGVQACRAEGAREVGLVVNLEPKHPASDAPEDAAAARRADAYMNRQYLDAACLGQVPEELPGIFGDAWPAFTGEDARIIRQPLDYLGLNYYSRSLVRHAPEAPFGQWASVKRPGSLRTAMDWEVYPAGLTEALTWIRERYGALPIYVNENGAAFPDPSAAPGEEVRDPLRVDYFRTHLLAVREALRRGVDVRGYSAWSLLDNFEWAFGYDRRFGIVRVEPGTLVRTPKASARFLAEVIATRGACLSD